MLVRNIQYLLGVNDDGSAQYSWLSVYHHYKKWSKDGSFRRLFESSIKLIRGLLSLSEINIDETHSRALKGGEDVAYQRRKKGKTSNLITFSDHNGYILASTNILPGNRNDSFELKKNLTKAFKDMRRVGIKIKGSYLNADKGIDTKAARKVCFNYGVIPNIKYNKRNQKKPKQGRKRLFNQEVYLQRYSAERSYAWIDKFRALLIRFMRKSEYFMGGHHIAFTMVNIRHLVAEGKV